MAYPVSADFVAALAKPQIVASRADLIVDGTVVETGLAVTAGSVTIEANKSVRRHGTLSIDGDDDQVDPYGTELAVYSGLVLPPGTPITNSSTQTLQADGTVLELIPMGVFGIEEPEATDDNPGLSTSFELYDRARSVAVRRLPSPYVVAAGVNVGTAIQTLLLSRRADLQFAFESTDATTPDLVWEEQADPWEKARELAASSGMDLFFDPSGLCVLRTIPAVDGDNVDWSYVEGDGCTLTKVARKRSAEQTYSHAIATGETSENVAAVRGDAYDDDPASPTYYLGRFGDRPVWLRSPYIRTQAQADGAAAGLLNRSAGLSEGLRLSAVPNPAIDADDLALVKRAALGLDAVYALDSVTVPLGVAEDMTAATRTRRVA